MEPNLTGGYTEQSRRESAYETQKHTELSPLSASSDGFGDDGYAQPAARTWRHEMPRWLAALNPGRTVREYEKAVTYFFEIAGVPQELDAISFDLLLAYRGALALRATPHERVRNAGSSNRPQRPALGGAARTALPGGAAPLSDEEAARQAPEFERQAPLGPLAPATVNIRLTALRQFLCHCSLMGVLPQLSPERVRVALRRLRIDRRRPYQVLAEPEWEQFLDAARMPMQWADGRPARPDDSAADAPADARQTPWGMPRAGRRVPDAEQNVIADEPEDDRRPSSPLPKSRAGLTGERTAQRDHALLSLALATGLRSIELAELDVADLHREWHGGHEEWWLVLPDAKTKGQHGGRTLPLTSALMETLLAYVRSTGRKWENAADRATPLFLSTGGRKRAGAGDMSEAGTNRRLSSAHIRLIVDRVEAQWLALRARGDTTDGLAAGETRAISPHALRHSTAIALLEGNVRAGRAPASVEHVRGWLGHFDIRTTQGYLAHLDARHHRRPFALSPTTTVAQTEQAVPVVGDGEVAASGHENPTSNAQ